MDIDWVIRVLPQTGKTTLCWFQKTLIACCTTIPALSLSSTCSLSAALAWAWNLLYCLNKLYYIPFTCNIWCWHVTFEFFCFLSTCNNQFPLLGHFYWLQVQLLVHQKIQAGKLASKYATQFSSLIASWLQWAIDMILNRFSIYQHWFTQVFL